MIKCALFWYFMFITVMLKSAHLNKYTQKAQTLHTPSHIFIYVYLLHTIHEHFYNNNLCQITNLKINKHNHICTESYSSNDNDTYNSLINNSMSLILESSQVISIIKRISCTTIWSNFYILLKSDLYTIVIPLKK